MLRLTRVRDGDRGAIAMIVAMLFGFGVMLGLGALTVDVGNINADRRQLQNGADAVALAAAQTCAKTGTCAPADPNLQTLADANAADGATAIGRVDGKAPAICGKNLPGLPPCQPLPSQSITNLQECPSEPAEGVKYVRVYTETLDKSRTKTLLPYYFGAAITGISGANQQACATVVLGSGYPPGEAVGVADALCAWQAATGASVLPPVEPTFPPMPSSYSTAPNSSPLGAVPVDKKYVTKVLLQGATNSTTDPATCGKVSTSGQYIAGNFGWLDVKPDGGCTAAITSDAQSVGGKPGGSAPGPPNADCKTYLESQIGKIIYIPIFTSMTPKPGQNAVYQIDGVSAFFLAGFQAPGASGANIPAPAYDPYNGLNPTPHCVAKNSLTENKDDGCLWGWYLAPLIAAGDISTSTTPRGPFIIGLNG